MCTKVKRAMFCTRNGYKHIENLEKVCVLVGRLKGLSESEYLDLCAVSKLVSMPANYSPNNASCSIISLKTSFNLVSSVSISLSFEEKT